MATKLTLDQAGQFVSTNEAGQSAPLGVIARKVRGRWQYRDSASAKLYASGMDPARFAEKFWMRKDFEAQP